MVLIHASPVHMPSLARRPTAGQQTVSFLLVGELEGCGREQEAPGRQVATQSDGRTQPPESSLHPAPTTSRGLKAPHDQRRWLLFSALPRSLLRGSFPPTFQTALPVLLTASSFLRLLNIDAPVRSTQPRLSSSSTPPSGARASRQHTSNCQCPCSPALPGAPDVCIGCLLDISGDSPQAPHTQIFNVQHFFCLYQTHQQTSNPQSGNFKVTASSLFTSCAKSVMKACQFSLCNFCTSTHPLHLLSFLPLPWSFSSTPATPIPVQPLYFTSTLHLVPAF